MVLSAQRKLGNRKRVLSPKWDLRFCSVTGILRVKPGAWYPKLLRKREDSELGMELAQNYLRKISLIRR